jgi:hypothetical protein
MAKDAVKIAVKFAKGRPFVVDEHGNPLPGAVVRRLNFPDGPVEVTAGRKWGPEHRPRSADIELNGVAVHAVPVRTSPAPQR